MSKICKRCGAVVEDNVRFCGQCGSGEFDVPVQENNNNDTVVLSQGYAPVQETPQQNYAQPEQQSAYAQQGYVQPEQQNTYVQQDVYTQQNHVPYTEIPKKKNNLPLILGIAGGGVALVVVIIILVLSLGGGYKKAIDNYFDVFFKGNANKIKKMAPEEYWEYYEDRYDMDMEDIKDEYEDEFEEREENFEDRYGKNWKVSYKIEDKKELSDKKLKKIADAIEDKYDIDADSVKKAYEVEIKATIKGSEDQDKDSIDMTVVKIDNSWYIIDYYELDGEYVVYFVEF